jgi:hypothetical protein
MARYICVVDRNRPTLYAEVAHDFHDDPMVQVVLDRRSGQRRTNGSTALVVPEDRRQADRRNASRWQRDLAMLGYAFVRVPSLD